MIDVLQENVFEELFGDGAVGARGAELGGAVEAAVDGVERGAELAAHVEPPVAHEHRLAELRAVGAQEGRLAAVDVAVVPRLAPRLHVREEARVRLLVAVEVGVRHHPQHRVVRAGPTCNTTSPPCTTDTEKTSPNCNHLDIGAFAVAYLSSASAFFFLQFKDQRFIIAGEKYRLQRALAITGLIPR